VKSPTIWVMAEEDAERLRRMSRSMRSPHRAALLMLGYQTLKDLASYSIRGHIPGDVLIRLQSLERLFKLHGLPAGIMSRYLRYVKRNMNPGLSWFGWDHAVSTA